MTSNSPQKIVSRDKRKSDRFNETDKRPRMQQLANRDDDDDDDGDDVKPQQQQQQQAPRSLGGSFNNDDDDEQRPIERVGAVVEEDDVWELQQAEENAFSEAKWPRPKLEPFSAKEKKLGNERFVLFFFSRANFVHNRLEQNNLNLCL